MSHQLRDYTLGLIGTYDTPCKGQNIYKCVGSKLHPPHRDGAASVVVRAMPNALFPCLVLRAVEDDEVSLVHRSHHVHILGGLL